MKFPIQLLLLTFVALTFSCSEDVQFDTLPQSTSKKDGESGPAPANRDGSKSPDRHINESFLVKATHTTKRVDILFVVDNSGSMREEQEKLSHRLDNFLSDLNEVNWQIGV